MLGHSQFSTHQARVGAKYCSEETWADPPMSVGLRLHQVSLLQSKSACLIPFVTAVLGSEQWGSAQQVHIVVQDLLKPGRTVAFFSELLFYEYRALLDYSDKVTLCQIWIIPLTKASKPLALVGRNLLKTKGTAFGSLGEQWRLCEMKGFSLRAKLCMMLFEKFGIALNSLSGT